MSLQQLIEHMRSGRFDRAQRIWLSLGQQRVQRPELVQAGAIIHEQLGQRSEAREHAQSALRLYPGQVTCRAGAAPPRAPDARRAPAFVVGLPRSGTTLLQEILQSHPHLHTLDEVDPARAALRELLASRGDQTPYPTCLEGLGPADWAHLREEYWRRVDGLGLPPHQLLIDKLPLNLVRLDYLSRLFPDSREVVVLRDPRDSLISFYFQDFTPNTAMVQSVDLLRSARMYAQVVKIWVQRREQLAVPWKAVRYEDLTRDPEAWVRELLDFLGASWVPDVLSPQLRAQRALSTPSRYDVARPVYRTAVGRWRRLHAQLEPVLPILEPAALALGYEPS